MKNVTFDYSHGPKSREISRQSYKIFTNGGDNVIIIQNLIAIFEFRDYPKLIVIYDLSKRSLKTR